MPEQYRRPSWHEANLRIERMLRARTAEQDALLIVRYFNARAVFRAPERAAEKLSPIPERNRPLASA
jgi:hypothetical protein